MFYARNINWYLEIGAILSLEWLCAFPHKNETNHAIRETKVSPTTLLWEIRALFNAMRHTEFYIPHSPIFLQHLMSHCDNAIKKKIIFGFTLRIRGVELNSYWDLLSDVQKNHDLGHECTLTKIWRTQYDTSRGYMWPITIKHQKTAIGKFNIWEDHTWIFSTSNQSQRISNHCPFKQSFDYGGFDLYGTKPPNI